MCVCVSTETRLRGFDYTEKQMGYKRERDRQTDRQTETETDGEGVSIETLLRGNAYIGESQGWVCAINNTGNDNEYVLFKFIVNMMVGRRMKKRRGK